MPDDLHAKILSRLAELRTTAEAANGDWRFIAGGFSGPLAAYIATWDPSTVLRWIGWAEDVARRHAPSAWDPRNCDHCLDAYGGNAAWPCDDITGLASVLGIEEGT